MPRFLAMVVVFLAVGPVSGAPPDSPFVPDEYTLFLAHFDSGLSADHSLGSGLIEGRGRLVKEGRFGGAVVLGPRDSLELSPKDNFPQEQGTVEFWIQPAWGNSSGTSLGVFSCQMDKQNYLNINRLADGRFGAGMSGRRPNADFVYRRADYKIADWKAGQWRHVAICWGKAERGASGASDLVLWLDGNEVAHRDGAVGPQGEPKEIRIIGSDYVLDEFCISNIVRYAGKGRVAGKPVPAHTRLARDWKFLEPPGVYKCAPPSGAAAEAGMAVLPKNYLDETDPKALPEAPASPSIELFASPGETEPATFLIVAALPLKAVRVKVSDMKSEKGLLPARCITIRRVVRTPMRRLYTSPVNETEIVNRFLPRWQSFPPEADPPLAEDVPAGELREVWLSFDLPADLPQGTYTGAVTIAHADGQRSVPVRLEVLPIRLIEHSRKQLGSYYRMASATWDTPRILRELRDMHAHGVRHLFSGLHVGYVRQGDKVVPDFTEVREGLDLIREAGFRNATVIIETGLPTLGRMLGHQDVRQPQSGESLDSDATFHQIAKEAMQQFLQVAAQYPDFHLVATHLDEVFGGKGLLDLYIRYSKAVRQVPQVNLYITFHTVSDAADEMRRKLIPFVDLRCNHGYSFELWLTRGHTMDEYEEELRRTGQQAWFYHNARGVHFTPEWARIINGIYLWASPFSVHCPWTYQAYKENPFDDTDGPAQKGHDFGMSFPGIEDAADLVPTRLWEAMHEGGDDLRYIATLEKAIAEAREKKPEEAAAADKFLARLKGLVRNARMTPTKGGEAPGQQSKPRAGQVDVDTGLIMGEGVIGTAAESPLINALAHRFTGDQWQGLRRQMAEWIVRLQ